MADRSIVVRLRADISDYQRKLGEARQATDNAGNAMGDASSKGAKSFADLNTQVGKTGAGLEEFKNKAYTAAQSSSNGFADLHGWVEKNKQSINDLSNTMGLVGAGMTAAAGIAVKRFADFDAAISSVQAATMETASNMALLRDAAIEAGADTKYSATEAAEGIENLAKAGVSTANILNGGLSGALNLAASDNIAVADAAEIAASAMTQFGLGGSDVVHIADLLAAGAGKAQGGVLDLGMALNQSGLVAAQMGLSIDETVGALTTFAEAGLTGSDAGTSFRAMLLRLANPTKESANLMAELGLQMYDAQGNFVGVEALAGQLQSRLGSLTQEQRNAALATIFGQDAIRTSAILYENGAEGVREWTEAVNDQGYAAEQARIRTDNLRGDVERLGGSLDTVFIQSGSGANDVLRQLAQGAEALVDRVGEIPGPVLTATTLLTGAGGLTALGIAGLGKLTVAVAETRTAMQALNISTKAAGVAAGAIGGALAIGTYLLSQWADAAAESKTNTDDFKGTLDEATGSVTKATEVLTAQKIAQSDVGRVYANLGGDLGDLTQAVMGNADALARVNALLDAQPKEKFAWMEFDNTGVDSVRVGMQGLSEDLTRSQEEWDRERDAVDAVGGSMSEFGGATDAATAAVSDATAAVEDQTTALEDLVDGLIAVADVLLGLRGDVRAFEEAYDAANEALKENGATLDVTTEKGRANQAALDEVASAGLRVVDSMRENGASQTELQAQMQATRDRFVEVAQQMGMSADEANALADQLNLIPTKVEVFVGADTSRARSEIDAYVAEVNARTATLKVNASLSTSGANAQMQDLQRRAGVWIQQANGGLWNFADGGGVDSSGSAVRRESMIASGGRNIMWAEPETGWEAYISGKPSMRNRNVGILSEVAGRFGYGLTKYDVGGYAGGYVSPVAAPAISLDGMRIVGRLDLGDGLTGLIDARVDAGLSQQQRAAGGVRQTPGVVR